MKYRSFLSILIVSMILLTNIVVLANTSSVDSYYLYKIDPELSKLLSSGEVVEVIVVLKSIDANELLNYKLAGGPENVKRVLKSYAYTTQSAFRDYVYSLGGSVLNSFWLINMLLIKIRADLLVDIAKLDIVDKVIPNYRVYVEDTPKEYSNYTTTGYVWSWGINRTRAPQVWEMGYNGSGVRICVIDTGVDISHPALSGKMLTLNPSDPYYPGGWMAFDSSGNPILMKPTDTYGHGTHVSGTALGGDGKEIVIGVAPGATLMHALALPYGSGTFAQTVAAMQWCVEPYYLDQYTGQRIYTNLSAHVVSMSWGARNYYGVEHLEAVRNMLLMNIIPVASIGNSGLGSTSNPGNIWGVFGIGAIDENDQVASFSSGAIVYWPYIPSSWPFYDTYPSRYIKPDFAAPGVRILSSYPGGGYALMSGTSMAAPHVAGTIALILQATRWQDMYVPDVPEKVYEILASTALDLGDSGQDVRYGWGIVDAYEAVRKALEVAKISGVRGYVYDYESGDTLDNVNIYAYDLNGKLVAYTRTNLSGYYLLPLDPGKYNVVFNRFGFENYSITVDVVIYNGTLFGRVLDKITGTPIPNAEVTVLELGIRTYVDENGFYQISLPPGRYTVKACAASYFNESKRIVINENEVLELNFQLYHISMQATVKVYVREYFTNTPISGANVSLMGTGKWALTDENGLAIISSLPPGSYTLVISKSFYATRTYNLALEPGEHELYVDTTYKIAIISCDSLGFGDDIRNALISMGYPSYAIYTLGSLSITDAYKVIILNMFTKDVDDDTLISLFNELDSKNTSIIFLDAWGTYYYFAGYVVYKHALKLSEKGYPAPAYRSEGYVYGLMTNVLNVSHPLFYNITFDEEHAFYIASMPTDRVDYATYTGFYTPMNGSLIYLGELISNGIVYGYNIIVWDKPFDEDKWVFLSVGGSYQWAKYMERGQDMQYSNNMKKLLINSILYLIGIGPRVNEYCFNIHKEEPGLGYIRIDAFKELNVYLTRKPYGWVEGTIYAGDTGKPLPNVTIVIKDTIVSTWTNDYGYYKLWLPQGTYIAVISAPGYYEIEKRFSIKVNETSRVDAVLLRKPRVAVMIDFASQLTSYLTSKGWYAKAYRDWGSLIKDLPFYDVIVLAGEYIGSSDLWPDKSTFEKLIAKTYELGIGIVFMNNYFEYRYMKQYPYGINLLYYYYKNPRSVGASYDQGNVFYQVVKSHPILEGYSIGERIYIIEGGDYDFAWFSNWDGDLLAYIGSENAGISGGGIGVKITKANTRWVLLAGLSPETWTNMEHWTDEAKEIFYRSVVWASVKPVNISITPREIFVGETLKIIIPPLPGVAFSIVIDDSTIIQNMTGSSEQLVLELKVPPLSYGSHVVRIVSVGKYYGEAEFFVKTSVIPSTHTIERGNKLLLNISGYPVGESLYIYIDDNYFSTIYASSTGSMIVILNIPDYLEEGEHIINLRRINGEVIATTVINVTKSSYQTYMENLLSNIYQQLNLSSSNTLQLLDAIINQLKILEKNTAQNISNISREINDSELRIINELQPSLKNIEESIKTLADLKTRQEDLKAKIEDLNTKVLDLETRLEDTERAINTMQETINTLLYVVIMIAVLAIANVSLIFIKRVQKFST